MSIGCSRQARAAPLSAALDHQIAGAVAETQGETYVVEVDKVDRDRRRDRRQGAPQGSEAAAPDVVRVETSNFRLF